MRACRDFSSRAVARRSAIASGRRLRAAAAATTAATAATAAVSRARRRHARSRPLVLGARLLMAIACAATSQLFHPQCCSLFTSAGLLVRSLLSLSSLWSLSRILDSQCGVSREKNMDEMTTTTAATTTTTTTTTLTTKTAKRRMQTAARTNFTLREAHNWRRRQRRRCL